MPKKPLMITSQSEMRTQSISFLFLLPCPANVAVSVLDCPAHNKARAKTVAAGGPRYCRKSAWALNRS
ncbi:hypothetical protein RO3G_07152 [Rhizopus delemar RA 99-880]|uniref:Uncharacterized protein n=1 Tax=Rhizopus delemar (strain RA 99-880 / ATCC MYA-4621 / FGSC 9543 / NRRL 43880) TaxID=246409 RepID=I1C1W7_RHIO9|nr:hypothetical protein RO3G_07152 [Rhizopus delemar RA 99-880]|eukprot:EIE82447.1 hypothetical protein RO3G_07152 [Rhizopus delemar RA 99-880]